MPNSSDQKTLQDWLTSLESLHSKEIDLGLARVSKVAQKLPLTAIANSVISVAGTNGKGSTICVLERILSRAGLKVGCYTSPHLVRYNERITIRGEEVSDEALCSAFSRVDQARGDTPLTYFEFGTLAAFDLFARADLDVALLEVGLGGRLDATNIIDADLAIVSSIALDHQDWLGDNREAIAFEKAGIMRAGASAVCGDPEPPLTLLHHAESLAVRLDCIGDQFGYEEIDDNASEKNGWNWWGHQHNRPIRLENLPRPELPLSNAATAIQALMQLGMPLQQAQISEGLKASKLAGRFQKFEQPVRMILDVAHNPHAAEYLVQKLKQEKVTGRVYALVGMLKDKDCTGVVGALDSLVDHWACCDLNANRAMSAGEIADRITPFGTAVEQHADVATGIEATLQLMNEQDLLVVFGSFYTVGAALQWLNLNKKHRN